MKGPFVVWRTRGQHNSSETFFVRPQCCPGTFCPSSSSAGHATMEGGDITDSSSELFLRNRLSSSRRGDFENNNLNFNLSFLLRIRSLSVGPGLSHTRSLCVHAVVQKFAMVAQQVTLPMIMHQASQPRSHDRRRWDQTKRSFHGLGPPVSFR